MSEQSTNFRATLLSSLLLRAILAVLALASLPDAAKATVRGGLGYSTTTSGRQIPALELGIDVFDKWMILGTFSGARTKAYYSSGIGGHMLRTSDWGNYWFGRLEVGFGLGAYLGEKASTATLPETGS